MFETDPMLLVTWGTDLADTIALAGPPADLPGAVPDFVGEIHDAIRSFGGGEGGLGETISELTPGGESGAGAENAGAGGAGSAGADTAGDATDTTAGVDS
ncbi:hypothetical protein SAMN05192561_102182 [Halopenitus malekzadehii]|uniref:Uncharacterized protein n=1 Tax=Halopenitus malekzadehii TaxID=1267564 RepID=A0A1H6IFI8_9EURY|nr:hypothetical protein [Halopenitus malekzadehii]SEH46631.1 hypothetical protein SAMN05192561_102182 [Halopenitus malekzadehii]